MHNLRARLVGSVVVLALLPTAVMAAWNPEPGTTIIKVEAEQGGAVGEAVYAFGPNVTIDGTWRWLLDGDKEIWSGDGSVLLGKVTDLALNINTDPVVSLAFAVSAGNVPTNFTITSAVLGFPAINNPSAVASASITVTDTDLNGASVVGLQPGANVYQARYNNPLVTYANLVTGIAAGAGLSNSDSGSLPPAGMQVIPGLVDEIQAQYKFTLSANDLASGTSSFVVVPEPASMGLLALSGLVLLRRRH